MATLYSGLQLEPYPGSPPNRITGENVPFISREWASTHKIGRRFGWPFELLKPGGAWDTDEQQMYMSGQCGRASHKLRKKFETSKLDGGLTRVTRTDGLSWLPVNGSLEVHVNGEADNDDAPGLEYSQASQRLISLANLAQSQTRKLLDKIVSENMDVMELEINISPAIDGRYVTYTTTIMPGNKDPEDDDDEDEWHIEVPWCHLPSK